MVEPNPADKLTLRTLQMKPRNNEAIKPAELIQVTGHHELTLNARRAITILWHSAHAQGIEEGKDYSIEIDQLKPDGHKGYEMVEEAIEALMRTLLTVTMLDGKTRRVQFLGGNDLDAPDRSAGVLTYSFDKRLIEILKNSAVWGKIAIPVLMAFTSKYAVSLYENIAQLSNLTHKTSRGLFPGRVPQPARRSARQVQELRRAEQACGETCHGRSKRAGSVWHLDPANQAGKKGKGREGRVVAQGCSVPGSLLGGATADETGSPGARRRTGGTRHRSEAVP